MNEPAREYQCPGEAHPISRAVHLGRLAQFYPACRTCPFRDETGTLSKATVKQLVATRERATPVDLFTAEGMAGFELNQIDRRVVRRASLALGGMLRDGTPEPRAVIASDGRPVTAELLAAAADGLRMTGCDVIELGAATSPALVTAMRTTEAAGGLLIGNPLGRVRTLGMKFWSAGVPLSQNAGIESLRSRYEQDAPRLVRSYGQSRRHQAELDYLSALRPAFHALRPLRVKMTGGSPPLQRYLRELTRNVACEFDSRGPHDESADYHLGVHLADDGEVLQVRDERGAVVPGAQLLLALARMLPTAQSPTTVIVENETPLAVRRAIEAAGATVVSSSATRAAMHAAMASAQAALGGGPSGRFWFADQQPLVDALRALSLLLVLLSESDRPLSAVAAADIFARS